jgi:hypothetical protein
MSTVSKILLAATLAVTAVGVVGTIADQTSLSPSRPTPLPSALGPRITHAQFMDHAGEFARETNPMLERLRLAFEVQDLSEIGAVADEFNVAVEAELDWQRANANRILGGCYDDAAAAYSDAVVQLASAVNYAQEYADSPDQDLRDLILQSSSAYRNDLIRFMTLWENADC